MHPLRIAIIDESESACCEIGAIFSAVGIEWVYAYRSVRQATLLVSGGFDIILSGYRLHGQDLLELYQREFEKTGVMIPVVLISCELQERLIEEAVRCSFVKEVFQKGYVLTKPLLLIETIKNAAGY